jgi:Ser/Thr protein kinase RdoA (MazF antagonist)
MSSPAMALTAQAVLDRYAALRGARLIPLGNRGGFSGARLWRVQTTAGDFCLRAWPEDGPGEQQLRWIHQLMAGARSAGLNFVPAVLTNRDGTTQVTAGGRRWEVTSWLPGQADVRKPAAGSRLAAACIALAHLHRAWAEIETRNGPCPAVGRRLRTHDEWLRLLRSGWQPALSVDPLDPLCRWARSAWDCVCRLQERIPPRLARWVNRPLPLQPCLCDVWHDHVLLEGNTVTGIVDYGSVKVDHVAVDLARLLGSVPGDAGAQEALDAYGSVRPLAPEERELVAVLDETGTILGAANWLRWLYHEGRRYESLDRVADHLGCLVARLERCDGVTTAGRTAIG